MPEETLKTLLTILQQDQTLKQLQQLQQGNAPTAPTAPTSPYVQKALDRQTDRQTDRQPWGSNLDPGQVPQSHLLPANLRWLGKSMINPGPMTGKDISPQEHQALLRAYHSSNDRVDLMPAARKTMLETAVRQLKQYPPETMVNYNGVTAPAFEHLANTRGQLTKSLQYSDYPPFRKEGNGIGTTPVLENLTDPSYSMSTAIGRARYTTEPDGSIHLKDTYNFPGKENTSLVQKLGKAWDRRGEQNLALGIPEAIAAHFSKDMPVDIQLTPATRIQTPTEQALTRQSPLPKPGYNLDENKQLDILQGGQ